MKIRRALISVWDKTGIVDFARALHEEFGVEIISTGGTAKTLRDAGIPVTLIEDITGFPEMLDGRVKTLHPNIHAAILADRDNPEHLRQLEQHGIKPIDMVVVNLYPFERTVADPNCTFEQAIEMIDIGGVTLLRAAAKNYKDVLVVETSGAVSNTLAWLRGEFEGDISCLYSTAAMRAFRLVTKYDADIAHWMSGVDSPRKGVYRFLEFIDWGALRYGENPSQSSNLLKLWDRWFPLDLTTADTVEDEPGQVRTSHNNYVDADAALGLCAELTRAARAQDLWYRLPAGSLLSPASSRAAPPDAVRGESVTRRYLPHIEVPGRTYFLTFRTRQIELPDAARDLVLSACRYWHERKMTLHIASVMPDHVHMLVTPYLFEDGSAVSLAELTHSIKSFSSNQVNKLLSRSGSLWMQERFDRIMRDEREFTETWEYIETNPERAGLGREYRWNWKSGAGFEDGGVIRDSAATNDGLEGRENTHRLEADTTNASTNLRAVCFIKHTNACGVGVAADPLEAYRRAYLGDPNAAMGGILACDFAINAEFAAAVMETYDRLGKPLKDAGAANAPGGFFVEVWVAPAFDDEAVKVIRTRKKWGENVRLLAVGDMTVAPDPNELQYRSIAGGVLVQTPDLLGLNEDQWKIVTQRPPTEAEMNDLRLAWLIAKHTKSNAISICKDGMLIGNGAGQMSRVMSCRIATWLARENGHADKLAGSAAASDAFFPFRDGPDILIDAGVTAIIQPGGSKRDEDTIKACAERNVAMIFTGTRHFKH